MPMWVFHEYIPLLSKSADGSAENQMIVESDDFNRQLYPSLPYKFLWSELIYSYFSNFSNSVSSNEIKPFAQLAPVYFGLSTRVA